MHLVQKGEILLTIQEALNQILEKSTNPTVKKEVQHLLNLLNFDSKLDEDWEQFAFHFDQVHVNFLKRLRDQFPQLSSNDYKLCAYLRMNLSTKEIAPLMNISVRGVEASRYRLRKKLNLPNDVNLTDFILIL
jgi:DNA-binding CsgD family transcriptional regulator